MCFPLPHPYFIAGPHFAAVNSNNEIIVTDFHNHSVKVLFSVNSLTLSCSHREMGLVGNDAHNSCLSPTVASKLCLPIAPGSLCKPAWSQDVEGLLVISLD